MTTDTNSVLIVDDSTRMRTFLHDLVADKYDAVFEAGNGEDAVRMYEEVHPDVVLMDIRMPGMDGIEATADILALDPAARVVIVTDHDNAAFRRDAMVAGAREYVLKENLHELLEHIGDMRNAK